MATFISKCKNKISRQAFCYLITLVLFLVPELVACMPETTAPALNLANTTTPTIKTERSPTVSTTETILTPTLSGSLITPVSVQATIGASNSVGKPTVTTDWRARWLKGIPCQPPCWEGITPGVTTADEVVKLLKQNTLVSLVKKDPPITARDGSVVWDWVDGPQSRNGVGGYGGDAIYELKTPSNFIIAIRPQYRELIVLENIIRAYGEPSHVIATTRINDNDVTKRFHNFWVVYLSLGFALENPGLDKPEISTKLALKGPIFFVPNPPHLEELAYIVPGAEAITPWQGFKSFDFYCQLKGCN